MTNKEIEKIVSQIIPDELLEIGQESVRVDWHSIRSKIAVAIMAAIKIAKDEEPKDKK